ncbi:hypothetical protein HYX14_05685 [Candidatus Woesearchaeota archaeon]|nr:hypothetical protein [Candidatus Woesearchaeota archaeon]
MSSLEIHVEKYKLFKKDANNQDNSPMTRIEASFEASFHIIESCLALQRIHINKHQLVRQYLEENKTIFGENTKEIWQKFQELENQIRPGQLYGGKINGERSLAAQQLFQQIESFCLPILRKAQIL